MPLNKLRRKSAKAAACSEVRKFAADQQICWQNKQARRSQLLQPALTSEKQKILLTQFILIN
jgi:hypothetical protein